MMHGKLTMHHLSIIQILAKTGKQFELKNR